MNWLLQLLDLNSIENLWQIIKIRVSSRGHRARMIEKLKVAIQEEWERLTEKNYRQYIECIHKQFKLVIQAKRGSIMY